MTIKGSRKIFQNKSHKSKSKHESSMSGSSSVSSVLSGGRTAFENSILSKLPEGYSGAVPFEMLQNMPQNHMSMPQNQMASVLGGPSAPMMGQYPGIGSAGMDMLSPGQGMPYGMPQMQGLQQMQQMPMQGMPGQMPMQAMPGQMPMQAMPGQYAQLGGKQGIKFKLNLDNFFF